MASSCCKRCCCQLVSTVTASSVGGLPRRLDSLDGGGLCRLKCIATGAGMHCDQFGPQRCGPPTGPRHGGGDVMELEIQKDAQPLLPQLSHHNRASLHKKLQAHLHPAQSIKLAAQSQGLLGRHAIESHDDPISGVI